MNDKELEYKITEIIYKNSHDNEEGLTISFRNIHKVIGLLVDLIENKKQICLLS
jgi:hypothetical protein